MLASMEQRWNTTHTLRQVADNNVANQVILRNTINIRVASGFWFTNSTRQWWYRRRCAVCGIPRSVNEWCVCVYSSAGIAFSELLLVAMSLPHKHHTAIRKAGFWSNVTEWWYLRKVIALIFSMGTSSPGWRANRGSSSSVFNTCCCRREKRSI